jgi:hypothetical protein
MASPPQGNSGSSVLAVDNRTGLTTSDSTRKLLLTVPSAGLIYEVSLSLLPTTISSGAGVEYLFNWTESGVGQTYKLTATTANVLQSNTILIHADANTGLYIQFSITSGSTNSDVACSVKEIA